MEGRVNWIDWLKVIVVFGVFLYHAAQPFVLTTWLVTDSERSVALSALAGVGYLFGMPLMFLLAGMAAWLALGSRGLRAFIGLRVRRLLLPLVLGIAFLSPAQVYVAQGEGRAPLAFLTDFWAGMQPWLNPQWLGDYGYHLWFLGFLFADSLLALPAISWLRRHPESAARLTGRMAERGLGLVLAFLPLAALQLVLRPAAPAYRDWADFALWLTYFCLGVVLATDARVVATIVARRRAALGVTLLLGLGYLPVGVSGAVLDLEHAPGYGPAGLAYVLLRTVVGFGLVLTFIGFGARYLGSRPRGLGWASRGVLPFYVIHHPVIVVVAVWAVGLPLTLWPKFGLIVAVSLVLSLAVYQAIVIARGWLAAAARRDAEPPPASIAELNP